MLPPEQPRTVDIEALLQNQLKGASFEQRRFFIAYWGAVAVLVVGLFFAIWGLGWNKPEATELGKSLITLAVGGIMAQLTVPTRGA